MTSPESILLRSLTLTEKMEVYLATGILFKYETMDELDSIKNMINLDAFTFWDWKGFLQDSVNNRNICSDEELDIAQWQYECCRLVEEMTDGYPRPMRVRMVETFHKRVVGELMDWDKQPKEETEFTKYVKQTLEALNSSLYYNTYER